MIKQEKQLATDLIKRRALKKTLSGRVSSIAGKRTIAVEVVTQRMHPRYKKPVSKTKRYLVDDPKGLAALNDIVKIIECRPISKRKRFRLLLVSQHYKDKISQQQTLREQRELEERKVKLRWLERYGAKYALLFQEQLALRRRANRELAAEERLAIKEEKSDKKEKK